MHTHRMLSSGLGLYPGDATSISPPVVTTKSVSRSLQFFRGQNHPQLKILGPYEEDINRLGPNATIRK
jgi:hypothetical protein